jgi:hypothetical protein
MQFRSLVGELVHAERREIHVHDLGDRPGPHDSRTQRGADDEGLGHRHVDYTALTEALKKTS